MYYCRALNGIIYYVHSETEYTARYREGGVKPLVKDYKAPYFKELLDMTNKERKKLMRKSIYPTTTPEYSSVSTGTSEFTGGNWGSTLTFNGVPLTPSVTVNSLATLADGGSIKWSSETTYEEEETVMYRDDCTLDPAIRTQNYLDHRLYNLKNTKGQEAEFAFGLRDDDKPQTPKDLIDRITSGKYMVNPDKMEKGDYEPLRFFRWRDPAKKEDRAGYEATQKAMETAATTVTDTIMIGTPAEALAALKAFESTTFH